MLKTLSKKELRDSQVHLKVIRSSIALVLSLMYGIGSVSQDSGELVQRLTLMKKTVVKAMHDFLNTWITRAVGNVFGSISSWDNTISSRLNKETKVCDDYLLLKHVYICSFYTAVAGCVRVELSSTS